MYPYLTRALAGMLTLAISLLAAYSVATAALVERERSLELVATAVPVWQLRADRLAVRECGDCPLGWLHVDDATVFEISGTGPVDREAFIDSASEPAGQRGVITLFLEPGTEYVRRLRLSPRWEN
jgi:hypothetical protein